jgi:hypothetical protein
VTDPNGAIRRYRASGSTCRLPPRPPCHSRRHLRSIDKVYTIRLVRICRRRALADPSFTVAVNMCFVYSDSNNDPSSWTIIVIFFPLLRARIVFVWMFRITRIGDELPYTEAIAYQDWAPYKYLDGFYDDPSTRGTTNKRALAVMEGDNRVLQVMLPEGCVTSECAMQAKSSLMMRTESATLKFKCVPLCDLHANEAAILHCF